MASYGHLAVGLLAGRLHGGTDTARTQWNGKEQRTPAGTLLFFAALAELPDADVLGVACGVRDLGCFGHRGASHSFLMAVVIGLLSGLAARRFGWPAVRTAVAATLAVASHGILDACGEGGRGIPLLWPLSDARFMSPWRLLPDAPRGMKMLSSAGLLDLAVEFAVFFPLTAFALWPGRRKLLRRRATPLPARPQTSALATEPARR
ncbi:MAG TPA: metal-dependent hydrolase [Polyangia bacterium]|jgi:inner membrane protein